MFILAKSGKTYARLRFNTGPGGHMQIPVEVDYQQPFAASDHEAWKQEYTANVQAELPAMVNAFGLGPADAFGLQEQELGFEDLEDWQLRECGLSEPESWL